MEHRDELDGIVQAGCAARTADEVPRAVDDAQAAIAPVLTMADIADDPHDAARGSVAEVDGVPTQGLVGLSATPGRIRWTGRPLGADTDEVVGELS